MEEQHITLPHTKLNAEGQFVLLGLNFRPMSGADFYGWDVPSGSFIAEAEHLDGGSTTVLYVHQDLGPTIGSDHIQLDYFTLHEVVFDTDLEKDQIWRNYKMEDFGGN